MRIVHIAAVVAVAFASGLAVDAGAAEHVVNQKNKAFGPRKLDVQAGDSIRFVNDDPFAHNVFSLSDAKSFDLGSWGFGVAKTVVLDKPGTVEVECAVHPDMRMVIEVRK